MSVAKDQADMAARVEQSLFKTEANLIAAYLEAADNLQRDIAAIYAKYGKDGTLSYSDDMARKRIEQRLKVLDHDLELLTGKAYDLTYKNSAYAYAEGYTGTAYSINNNYDVDISFDVVNKAAIIASVQAPVAGVTLSNRFTLQHYDQLVLQRQVVTQGMIQGWSIDRMAAAIDAKYSIGLNEALRTARTETTRNQSDGQLTVYDDAKDQGIHTQTMWIATHQKNTRETHGALDQTFADKDGYFHIGSDKAKGPGQFSKVANSVNCRCRLIVILTDYPECYPKYDSYADWQKKQGIKAP